MAFQKSNFKQITPAQGKAETAALIFFQIRKLYLPLCKPQKIL